MVEDEQAESSSNRNWIEALHLYTNAISRDNDGIKIGATIKLAKMSRYAPEHILAQSVPPLSKLLQCPPSQLSPFVQEASAYCLKCIATRGEGRVAKFIGQFGTIPILVRLLPDSEEHLRRALLKCLRNVIIFWEYNRMIFFRNGGLDIVLAMLNSCSDNLKLILYEILSVLAFELEVRKSPCIRRRVHHLVEATRHGSIVARTRAAHALGLIGMFKRPRCMLVNIGAIPVLVDLLKVGDINTKVVAGNSLGVIASRADNIRVVVQAGVIPLYVELLQAGDADGTEIAENMLSLLAAFGENAVPIVEHMVGILRGDDARAKAAAADVIRNISSYNNQSPVLQNSGAIPILVELLKDENVNVRGNAAGAVARLSDTEDGRAVLASSGAIPLLISMLDDESDEPKDNAAEALVNFSQDPSVTDQMSSVMENPLLQSVRVQLMQIEALNAHLDPTGAGPGILTENLGFL